MTFRSISPAALLLWALALAPALAVLGHGPVWRATYVAAYAPTFGPQRIPHSGILRLRFSHGIVSGTYVSESVRPDPLYGRTISVSGGVKRDRLLLNLAVPGGFTVNGTLHSDGAISGTATFRGRLYTFRAAVKSSP